MNSIDAIISGRVEKAKTEQANVEEENRKANVLTQVRQLAEHVRCFWPSQSTDPKYNPWNDDPPSRKYWENKAGAIIDLCRAAKKLGFDGEAGEKTGEEEAYVQEIYRLAFGGKKKRPADLLSKLWDCDKPFREQCERLIRVVFPERILLAVGEKEVEGDPELATEAPSELPSVSISTDDEYHGFFNTEIKKMTGLENNALNKYRELANVPKPGIGKGNFKQKHRELVKLLNTIITDCSNSETKSNCQSSLETLTKLA